jgi:hypothetical protein
MYVFKITALSVANVTTSHMTIYMCLDTHSFVEFRLERSELFHKKFLPAAIAGSSVRDAARPFAGYLLSHLSI